MGALQRGYRVKPSLFLLYDLGINFYPAKIKGRYYFLGICHGIFF
jgi:hypothetical protein